MNNPDISSINIKGTYQLPTSVTYETQHVPKPSWLGRDLQVIYPKSPFWIAFKGVIAAILVTVGALIVSAHPLIGGSIIAAGALMGAYAIKKMIEPDELEETVKYLANTEDLNALPELNPEIHWEIKENTNVDTGKKSGSNIAKWKSSDMIDDIMALKRDGKTIAVAFKFEKEDFVEVIALQDELAGFTSYNHDHVEDFSVSTSLSPRDLNKYTELFKRLQ
ncbi:MAG: hypothetical protein H0T62_04855 [Parachlamydiaceae bacterium]|nr:hypothetical protein [Parachlamydiaceae bacterium]